MTGVPRWKEPHEEISSEVVSLGRVRPAAGSSRWAGPTSLRPASTSISDDLMRLACDRAPGGIAVSAVDGRWLWINDAFCEMVGYGCDDLVGRPQSELTHHDDVSDDELFARDAIEGSRVSFDREKRYIRKDGSPVWASVRVQLVRDEQGTPVSFVSHIQDITERRHAQELLRDSERRLRSVIDHTPAAISVKGRDHRYQLVNREFATMYGKDSDWIVGRRDDDLLPPSTIADVHAKDLAVLDSGHSSQEETTVRDETGPRVLLVTRFPLPNVDGVVDAVCSAATDITHRRLEEQTKRERLECSELIYSALAERRLVLHAQPIVSLGASQPMRAELLIRMRDKQDSSVLVPPGQFLPDAERFGLIGAIDEWVVDRAIELATRHPVTVNVSARTICTAGEVDRIEQAITTSHAPTENLVFEITETAVADDLDAAQGFVTRMRSLGCGVALDDFGVGHGSFTYLRHLSVDYLKIDMQFVRDLLTDEENRQVVAAIVGVARQFDVSTIAEGVEDQATLELLRRMGVDYAQGYFTGRPMPLSRVWMPVRNPRQGAEHVTTH